MRFYEKLVFLRKRDGYTQEQLAEQLGVSRQAISRWEVGETTPDMEILVKLCLIFQVSADYLINDEVQAERDIPVVKKKNYELGTHRLISAVGFGIAAICNLISAMVATNDAQTGFSGILFVLTALLATVFTVFYVKKQ